MHFVLFINFIFSKYCIRPKKDPSPKISIKGRIEQADFELII